MKSYFYRGRQSRRQTTGRVRVFATANTERTIVRAERQGLGQSPNEKKGPQGDHQIDKEPAKIRWLFIYLVVPTGLEPVTL